jgi:hypothetical protein
MELNEAVTSLSAANSLESRSIAAKEIVALLPEGQKQALVEALGARVPDPDQDTGNRVWLIIIWAFALVMGGAVIVLGVGFFVPPAPGGTKADTLLTIFTTVTAFLVGLLAPSPVSKKD